MGFVGIDFQRLRTRYDAGRGFSSSFRISSIWMASATATASARVRVNIDKGTVTRRVAVTLQETPP